MEAIAEGVPRLEALRLRDLLADAGVPCVLEPDFGLDLSRPTAVMVDDERADFARQVIHEADEGVEYVPDNSPAALLTRITEHLDALRGLVAELSEKIDSPQP